MELKQHLIPKLKALRLSGILDTLEVRTQQALAEQWTYGDFLERLLEDEVERRGQKQLALRVRRLGADRVAITVEDNGPGMTEEVRKRIFEPFFTTKPQGVGTGVGLSLCHGIVAAHEGRIDVATVPGKGSRFKVRLPLVATPPSEEAAPAEGEAPARRASVLVVDDEAEIADLVREVLGRAPPPANARPCNEAPRRHTRSGGSCSPSSNAADSVTASLRQNREDRRHRSHGRSRAAKENPK